MILVNCLCWSGCGMQLSDYQGSQFIQQPPVETIVGGKC